VVTAVAARDSTEQQPEFEPVRPLSTLTRGESNHGRGEWDANGGRDKHKVLVMHRDSEVTALPSAEFDRLLDVVRAKRAESV
jgi:hypothetical protein